MNTSIQTRRSTIENLDNSKSRLDIVSIWFSQNNDEVHIHILIKYVTYQQVSEVSFRHLLGELALRLIEFFFDDSLIRQVGSRMSIV